jgi:hypothetical protein
MYLPLHFFPCLQDCFIRTCTQKTVNNWKQSATEHYDTTLIIGITSLPLPSQVLLPSHILSDLKSNPAATDAKNGTRRKILLLGGFRNSINCRQ